MTCGIRRRTHPICRRDHCLRNLLAACRREPAFQCERLLLRAKQTGHTAKQEESAGDEPLQFDCRSMILSSAPGHVAAMAIAVSGRRMPGEESADNSKLIRRGTSRSRRSQRRPQCSGIGSMRAPVAGVHQWHEHGHSHARRAEHGSDAEDDEIHNGQRGL